MKAILFTFLINIGLISVVSAQVTATPPNREFGYNQNAWMVYTGTHKLTKKIALYTEFQFRRNNWISDPLQIQVRSLVDYKLTDKVTVSGGYVWTDTWSYGSQPATSYRFGEHRPFEQITLDNRMNRFYISHRYRFEQRIIETKVKDIDLNEYFHDDWIFRNRFRYRLQIQVPLNNKEMVDKTLFFSVYDELFASFGKNVKKNMFDQNRIYMGFGYRFNHHFNIQAGYLLQSILKSDAYKMEQDHTVFLGINYSLDFTKKEQAH